FALFDGLGAAFWAGGAIVLGVIFHEAVAVALEELELLGRYAIVLLVAAIALVLVCKAWQRYRFSIRIRMARITPKELIALLASKPPPAVVDVRAEPQRIRSGWI